MASVRYEGLCWPKGTQRLLVEALFLPEERARAAFAA